MRYRFHVGYKKWYKKGGNYHEAINDYKKIMKKITPNINESRISDEFSSPVRILKKAKQSVPCIYKNESVVRHYS